MEDASLPVPRRIRRFVYAYLGVFLLAGVAHLEAWPFTGFRLFSELRSAQRESWQIVALDGVGHESAVHLSDLPVGMRASAKLIDGFADLSAADRNAVCDAWVQSRRDRGADVVAVRIYARIDGVRPGDPLGTRTLAYVCATDP